MGRPPFLGGRVGGDEYKPDVLESKVMCGQENTGRPGLHAGGYQKNK